MRKRKVLVLLDSVDYKRLAEQAKEDEREVYQQASLIVRRALDAKESRGGLTNAK